MSRFPFASLDLSLIPAPDAVHPVDYEAIRSERLAELVKRFVAAGIPFNVDSIETDPSIIHQEEDAYREMMDLQAINDAVRAVLLAYSTGSDLDNLGALLGLRRLTLPDGTPEGDEAFRFRLRICLDATAVGLTGNGYKTIALQTSSEVKAVSLVKKGGGQINVVLLGRGEDGSISEDVVMAVSNRLNSDDGGQLTDIISVQSAVPLAYDVVVDAIMPVGPSVATIIGASEAAIRAKAEELKVIGGVVPTDALIAAGRIIPMTKFVLVSPDADVIASSAQVPYLRSITVRLAVSS